MNPVLNLCLFLGQEGPQKSKWVLADLKAYQLAIAAL